MAMPEMDAVKDAALKYDKPTLGRLAQMGQISPTIAVMAGMMRDRIVQSEMKPPSPPTVAEEVMQPMGQRMGLAAAQQMPQQPQAPQQPQQPQPQSQGLNQVPVPQQMFERQGMANGGIVAFQAGGDARNPRLIGALENVLVQLQAKDPGLNVDYVRRAVLSAPESQQRQLMQQLIERTGMDDQFKPAVASFTEAVKSKEVDPKVLRAMQVSGGLTPDEMAAPSSLTKEAAGLAAVARDATQSDTGAQYGARPLTGSQILAQKADAAGNIYARPAPPMTTDVSGMPGTFAPYEDVISQLGQGVPEPIDPFSATQGRTSIRGGQTDPGFVPQDRTPSDAMLKQAAEDETKKAEAKPKPTAAKAAAEGEAEKPKSYDAYLNEVMNRMGTSTAGKDMREDIKKDREARNKAKQEAGWLRLVEAGLGIMGGDSPYAMVNIGKGATNALKGYADDLREQKKLDREDRKILLDLDRAERAEQRDNYKLAAELREKALDRMSAETRTRITAEASKYQADMQGRIGAMAYGPGGLKPTTEATIRNNAATNAEARLLMDDKFREAQKRKDQLGMIQRRNDLFLEELRKLTPGGGASLGTSGPVLDYSALMGIK
jgi:hypothetical protein